MELDIEWWGTAAFRIRFQSWTALLDPYITRNPFAYPKLQMTLNEAAEGADHIFVSHGHFDHIADIPALLKKNQKVRVFAPPTAIRSLRRDLQGEYSDRLHETCEGQVNLGVNAPISVETYSSKHVHFDLKLILSTLAKAMVSEARSCVKPRLLTHYPSGECVSYVFNLGGFRIRYLGSAGPTDEMLDSWGAVPIDCLLVPMQGNSDINQIGAKIVEKLKPKIVIPHHYDMAYPPIMQNIDISEFKELVARNSPESHIMELRVGESLKLKIGEAERPTQVRAIQPQPATHL